MNLGTVTSFLIGGILLLSILRLDASVHSRSDRSTLDLMAKTNTETIADVISYDLRNAGYRVGGNVFSTIESQTLTFYGDINFDGVTDEVTWMYKSNDDVNSTQNPNDHYLYRIVNSDTLDFSMVATHFALSYFDADGHITNNPEHVTGIKVELVCQSPQASDDDYPASAWEKTIYPINLNL